MHKTLWLYCVCLMVTGGNAFFVARLALGRAVSGGDGILVASFAVLGVAALTVATWAILHDYARRGGTDAD